MATRWIARSALFVVSLALSLAVAEGLARIVLPPPASVAVHDASESIREHGNTSPNNLLISTPQGRRLRPDSMAVIRRHWISGRDVVVRTNSLGLRGPEIDRRRCARKILFVGDSITAQDYLPAEETIVSTVEMLARSRGQGWCTINAGVSGTGIENHLLLLDSFGPLISPDLAVVGLYLNDYRQSPSLMANPPPAWLGWSWLACAATDRLRSERFKETLGQHVGQHRSRLEARRKEVRTRFATLEPALAGTREWEDLVASRVHDWGGVWTDQAWEVLTPTVERMHQRSQELGARMIVVAFPVRHQVAIDAGFDYPQRRMAALCRRLEVPFLDLLPALRTLERETDRALFYDQCHPTPAASRVIAEEIYDVLSRY